MDLKKYIRDVPDFPKPGIIFKDITTLIGEPAAFRFAIDELAKHYAGQKIAKVVGIESRGFIFAAALAYELKAGMIPVRKLGKLPAKTIREEYALEYGTDCVEIHADALTPGESVIVIDDVLATGGTLAATCQLVEKVGGKIAEAATVIELTFLNGRTRLEKYPFYSMIQY